MGRGMVTTYGNLQQELDEVIKRVLVHRQTLQQSAATFKETVTQLIGAPEELVSVEMSEEESLSRFLGPAGERADARIMKFDLVVQFGDGNGGLVHESHVPVKLRLHRHGVEVTVANEGPFHWQPGTSGLYSVENALSEYLRKGVRRRADLTVLEN